MCRGEQQDKLQIDIGTQAVLQTCWDTLETRRAKLQ